MKKTAVILLGLTCLLSSVLHAQDAKIDDDAAGTQQASPRVAKHPRGPMMAVWQDNRNDSGDIYAQLNGRNGFPMPGRGNFRVNDDAGTVIQNYPDVCMDYKGVSLVVWTDNRDAQSVVYGQYFLANGDTLGGNFAIGSAADGVLQIMPRVACSRRGRVLVVWSDNRLGGYDIYTQWIDYDRSLLEGNTRINSDTTSHQVFPAIDSNPHGVTVIAWADRRSGEYRIYARCYDADGESDSDWEVSSTPDVGQTVPAVAVHDDGSFMICWEANDESGYRSIFARIFEPDGTPRTDDMMISERLGLERHAVPDVAAVQFRRFEVVWQSDRLADMNIYARMVESDGTMHDASEMINEQPGQQTMPAVISDTFLNHFYIWADTRDGDMAIYGNWQGPYWPNHVTAGDGHDGLVPLSWQHPFGYDASVSYTISRSDDVSGPYTDVTVVDPSTRILPGLMLDWIDTDVANGVRYYYNIQMNAAENEGEKWTTAATPKAGGHRLDVPWAVTAPVIDGDVSMEEWINAARVPMAYNSWQTPLTVLVMNDGEYLYIAAVDYSDGQIEAANGLGLLIDNDASGTWDEAPPSDEGALFITENQVTFAPFYGKYPIGLNAQLPIELSGADVAFMVDNGALWIEAAIPLNSTPLSVGPGDVIGAAVWLDDPGHDWGNQYGYAGQWPEGALWEAAESLGRMALASPEDTVVTADWPMNGRTRGRTSWADQEYWLYPPFEYEAVWRFDSIQSGMLSCANGRIIGGYHTPDENVMMAIDAATGDSLWQFKVTGSGGASHQQPAIGHTLVYGGGQSGNGLYALDTGNGVPIWMKPVGSLFTRHAILDGDRLYLAKDSLFCLNRENGLTIWSYRVPHSAGTPAVGRDAVFLTHGDSALAFDKYTGAMLWKQPGEDSDGNAVDRFAYYGFFDDQVMARSLEDGEIIWSYTVPDKAINDFYRYMAVSDNAFCFTCNEDDDGKARLVVLNKNDGSLRWEFKFATRGVKAPTIANDIVYVVDFNMSTYDGVLYGFKISNGDLVLLDNSEDFGYQPIVAEGRLYVPIYGGVKVFSHTPIQTAVPVTDAMPVSSRLLPNYPNPFNPTTQLTWEIARQAQVNLSVYDMRGRLVAKLVDEVLMPGQYIHLWNAGRLASGVYCCRLQAGDKVDIQKLMLLK